MSTTTAPGTRKTKPKPLTKPSAVNKWLDQRLGIAKVGKENLGKVFPDHWSFMLGEITLYCFIILLVTGAYLTFFFEPSARSVIYNGSYAPLHGTEMSAAYQSALNISFHVKAGLVMRQMHHWSALLFLAAMVVHMLRVFFTGAYRRPRELNWIIGVNLLILGIFNGFLGYSLLDDLLSGTGVRVGYSILLSIPFVGPLLANLVFGGNFPSDSLIPRFFAIHVLLLPAAIVGLLSAHLGLVFYQKHTQFRGPERTEDNVVGTPLFPVYMFKMAGLLFFVVAVCGLLAGVAQINPIWKFGPFHSDTSVAAVSSASQPDWYMGWLDGLLRLIPGWETRFSWLEIPNYFWAGLVFPGILFTGLMLWPFLEPRWTNDREAHNLLQRPREMPRRTAFGAAVLAMLVVIFLESSNDVLSTIFDTSPEAITDSFRALVFIVPIITYFITKKLCDELNGTEAHPAAPGPNHVVVRNAAGGYTSTHEHHDADAGFGHALTGTGDGNGTGEHVSVDGTSVQDAKPVE